MTTHETKVVHTTDRFMKVLFTIIALSLVWLSVKDTRLEPGVTLAAQPDVYDVNHFGRIRISCIGCGS